MHNLEDCYLEDCYSCRLIASLCIYEFVLIWSQKEKLFSDIKSVWLLMELLMFWGHGGLIKDFEFIKSNIYM